MPILIGAAMIAVAILLSTLITAVGTRFAGVESPTEETMWLIDRLTGSVYRCEAEARGNDLLLDIDVQGASKIKQKIPDAVSI